MRHLLAALLLSLLLVGRCYGQQFDPVYGRPLVVLISTDPWLMVIGSDVPTFALYENGQVIYRKTVDRTARYFTVSLSPAEAKALLRSVATDSIERLPGRIEASMATDQPDNILLLNGDSLTSISVYGRISDPNHADRAHVPRPLLRAYDKLFRYEHPQAKPWQPARYEIMLTDYSYSPEKPVKWPSAWPTLQAPTTVQRSETLYSIYLDQQYAADFLKLYRSLKQKQAVEIDGRKFSPSYRLPFPNIR